MKNLDLWKLCCGPFCAECHSDMEKMQEELANTKLLAKQLAEYVNAVRPFVSIPAFPACTYPTEWEKYQGTWKALCETPFSVQKLQEFGVIEKNKQKERT